jgi:hypothetical protein
MHELARHSLRDVGHGDRGIDRIGEPELVALAFFLRRGEPLLGHEQLRPLFENEGWTESEQKKTIHEESKEEPWPRALLASSCAGRSLVILSCSPMYVIIPWIFFVALPSSISRPTNHLRGLSGRTIPDRRSKQHAS